MSDKKISQLTDGGVIQGTDSIPVVRGGANNKTVLDLAVLRLFMPSALTYSGTAHTVALADLGLMQYCSNASAQTITIPPNSSVASPVNAEISLCWYGAGQPSIAAGAGVTIKSDTSKLKIGVQNTVVTAKQTATTDTWVLFGNLSA